MLDPRPTWLTALAAGLSIALLTTDLDAQRRWSLDQNTAAIYDREEEYESRGLDGVHVGTPSAPGNHAPMLLGSELDERRLRQVRGVFDWHGVVAALAFDLELGGAKVVERRFEAVSRVGDIVCRVKRASPGQGSSGPTTGEQGTAKAKDPNTDVFVADFYDDETAEDRYEPEQAETIRHYHQSKVRGSIRITRHFDPESRLVDRFSARASFDYTMATGDGMKSARIEGTESWQLNRVIQLDQQSWLPDLEQALGRGANALRERIADDEGAHANEEQYALTQGPTLHALVLRAAYAADPNADFALLEKRAQELRDRKTSHTRSLAEWIRTVSRLEVSVDEKKKVRREIRAAAKRLLAAREPGRPELHFPGHLGGRDSDPMITAAGVEALLDAADSYAKVSDAAWVGAARAILVTQSDPEPIRLEYTTRTDGKTNTERTFEMAGWVSSYYSGAGEHGSPTAASLAVLARLRPRLPKRDRRLLAEVDQAIRRGLGWIGHHFTVRTDPSIVSNDRQYDDYWLEWMSLALRRNNVTLLEGRDWIFELQAWTLAQDLDTGRASGSGVGGLPRILLAHRPSVAWWEK